MGGQYRYLPNAGFTGTDTFTYRVSDGTLSSNLATVTITVLDRNAAPVAQSDTRSTAEDTAITFDPRGNDSDADGDALTIVGLTSPSHGLVGTNADGSITYTPAADFFGTDTFTYAVNDGRATSNIATITIVVEPRNDAPVARPDIRSTAEDTAITFDPRGNDSDVDGDALTIVGLTSPSHGLVGTNADGTITYTPNANFFGTDTFTYAVSDGQATSNIATITIVVESRNDAPVAQDDPFVIREGRTLTVTTGTLLSNDSDPEGDPISVTGFGGASNGTVSFDGTQFVYTPVAGFAGEDAFTYRISDGIDIDTATVRITVVANQAPLVQDDPFVIREGRTLAVTSATLLANDSDPEGDPISVTGFSGASHGTVSFDGTQFTYTPNAGFSGEDAFNYVVGDGLDTATAAVKITVVDNRAPVATDDPFVIREGRTLTVTSATLLANDSDPEGDAISVTGFGGASNGTVSFDGTQFVYTPVAGFAGEDAFTYRISDGLDTATAAVKITVVDNRAPVATDDPFVIREGRTLTVTSATLLANDSDPEGDAISVSGFSGASHGTVSFNGTEFTYTPLTGFSGEDAFNYVVSDGLDTATAAVKITVVDNRAPVAGDDAASTGVGVPVVFTTATLLANDSDPDGDPITVTGFSGASNGTVSFDGTQFIYTPVAGFAGQDAFTYRIGDGLDTDSAVVRIDVIDGNRAPVARDDAFVLDEDTSLSIDIAELLRNDSDPDGDPLGFVLLTGTGHGTLADLGNGVLRYTPDANFHGEDRFTYRVNDGRLDSPIATVTLGVRPVNDDPVIVFTGPSAPVVDEGQAVVIAFTVTDIDGDVPTLRLDGAPAGAEIIRTGTTTAEFRWTADDGDALLPFEIVASDGVSEVRAAAAVAVRNVAPTLTTDGAATALSGQPYTLRLGASDPGQDTLIQWVVDWGDGSALQAFAGNVREVQHVFAEPERTHTIQVGAFDEDGAWSAAPRVVEVVNDLLWVRTLTPDDSGFRVRFNRAFDPAQLNLYESAIVPRGGPDIVVTDSGGNVVRGSFVLDADRQGFAFVATNVLPAGGTYQVTLASRSNAFVDSLARPLDGNKDNVAGDAFRTAFTILPTTAPTVTIAHAVAGPKQQVDIPATSRGIPISLTTTQPATEIRFQLRYDPALLTVVGLEAGADLPTGSTFTIIGTAGNFTVRIVASSPIAAGVRELVRLLGSVPESAPYASAEVLDIVDAFVDGRGAREADGVHVAAYFGDASGDRRYTSLDAQRVSRVVAGLDTGYAAYPGIDPVLIGDVNRNGMLDAADGSILVSETQFLLGGQTNPALDQPQIPPIPATQMTAVLSATGQPVQTPLPGTPSLATARSSSDGGRSLLLASAGPQLNRFDLAASMERLNSLRITTPVDELAERFAKGGATWAEGDAPASAEQSWKVTLPTLTQGVRLSADTASNAAGDGMLQALKYLVARKVGRRV